MTRSTPTNPEQTCAASVTGARLLDWLAANRGRYEALVLDVDGVLMIDHRPTARSQALIAWLRETDVPFLLLTNDGCNSSAQKADALRRCGLEFSASELVSASHGLVALVRERGWAGARFFVMGELGEPSFVAEAGLVPVHDLSELGGCFGVAIGEKVYDWHATISAVFNFLLEHSECPLVVPNPDLYFPISDGRLQLASGAVASFLQSLCESCARPLSPIYLGKPHAPIFSYAHGILEDLLGHDLAPERVLIVGDSLTSDIEGGARFGYRTGLIMGGITTSQRLVESPRQPDLVFAAI